MEQHRKPRSEFILYSQLIFKKGVKGLEEWLKR
jgi:hypothetical protein